MWLLAPLSRLHHFRRDCNKEVNATFCQEMWSNYEEEKTLWNHKAEIMARAQKLLQSLGFYVQRNLTGRRRAVTTGRRTLPLPPLLPVENGGAATKKLNE